MIVNVTSAPATEPVSLAEAKLHLKVETAVTADDDLITGLIKAAREFCENYEGRKYITQTLTLKLDNFADIMVLPYAPVASVSSVKYIDTSGTQQTLSASYYSLDSASQPARVTLAYGYSWPSVRDVVNAVEIIYVCGYGAAAAVPQRVKLAMLLLITEWYEKRSTGEASGQFAAVTPNSAVFNILQDKVWW